MDWQERIRGCFGLEDRQFAGHPSDEERAFELLTQLRQEHVGWAEFERELRQQLGRMPKLNPDDEVDRVAKYFRVWMLD